jgi:hypothetical protein
MSDGFDRTLNKSLLTLRPWSRQRPTFSVPHPPTGHTSRLADDVVCVGIAIGLYLMDITHHIQIHQKFSHLEKNSYQCAGAIFCADVG